MMMMLVVLKHTKAAWMRKEMILGCLASLAKETQDQPSRQNADFPETRCRTREAETIAVSAIEESKGISSDIRSAPKTCRSWGSSRSISRLKWISMVYGKYSKSWGVKKPWNILKHFTRPLGPSLWVMFPTQKKGKTHSLWQHPQTVGFVWKLRGIPWNTSNIDGSSWFFPDVQTCSL